jgi:hypothetical protein
MIAKDREEGGRLVREEWIRWAESQLYPKPSWLVPWKALPETDKEADRRIWEAITSPYRYHISALHRRIVELDPNCYVLICRTCRTEELRNRRGRRSIQEPTCHGEIMADKRILDALLMAQQEYPDPYIDEQDTKWFLIPGEECSQAHQYQRQLILHEKGKSAIISERHWNYYVPVPEKHDL